MINTNFVSREDYEEALLGLCRPRKNIRKETRGFILDIRRPTMAIKSSGWRLIPEFSGASCLIWYWGKTTPLGWKRS